jgi:predicted enzyme related to lactoylglutathione lyase
MSNPVSWFEIQGRNAAALQEFYVKAFGWKGNTGPGGMMVAPEKGGIAGSISAPQNPDIEKHTTVYIGVDNLEAALAKIEAAGGKLGMPPMDLPENWGRIAGFIDPAGNWIGLHQAPPKPARAVAKRRAPAKRSAKKAAKKTTKKAAKKTAKRR